MEHWRVSLSRLGTKLSVISVISFAGKAVLAALVFFGILRDGNAMFIAISTITVEAVPSLLTIIFLAAYHFGSSFAARGEDSLGTSLVSRTDVESASTRY
jgi:hypothetical protein